MPFIFSGYQKSVAWDMMRVYNDFIDAQERRRYFFFFFSVAELDLEVYALNLQIL